MSDNPKTLVELFSQPGTWTKGALAKTKDGFRCWPRDSCARSFCLVGGIMKVYQGLDIEEIDEIHEKIRAKISESGEDTISAYNDHVAANQDQILNLCKELGI